MALFVEFAVVGQVSLGDKAQQLPPADGGGTVVQLAVHQHRQPHQGHQVHRLAGLADHIQPFQGRLLQSLLEKQIPAGIAGKAQLREHRQLDPPGRAVFEGRDNLPGIVGAVRHPQGGRKGRSFQKTILHTRHILSIFTP